MFALLYGLNLLWRAIAGAMTGLFALLSWGIRSFARLSPTGKLIAVIATLLLSLAMSRFDIPVLEGESPRSVVDGYVRPEFDPQAHAAEQAEEAEYERTLYFPIYAEQICEELEATPGKAGAYEAMWEIKSTVTYREALEVLHIAEKDCPDLAERGRLEDFRRLIGRSRTLFRGSPDDRT